nr:hypothetical protein [Tanacetum cinerariifolium]
MDINIDDLYNILKQNQGDVNDAMGSKKKTDVVTFDPLALIAEKTKVSKSKEKVVVFSDSEGSDADDFSELKKITALLAKAFNRRKFYSKPTNNNLRTSSTSQSVNKKQEFVKTDNKKVEKKGDEKNRDMSRVKCYNCKKEGHFAKDCKKVKVKDYEYYKTKMLLAKKDKDEQVLLAEDQAWMESRSDSDQEINANMVFMAQIEKFFLIQRLAHRLLMKRFLRLTEFIKSSVENLVPNPSESKGEHECDVPACNDFTTFSNLLFDVDGDFSSCDDPSFYDEDIPKKIYSNPLFDEEIISMKIDPHHFNIDSLLDEFAGELTLLKSILSRINETDCDPEEETCLIKRLLYDNSSPRPPKEFISENSDTEIESFSLFPIHVKDSDSFMEEIDLSFTPDDPMPPGIEEDDYDSERDILIFEELLRNDSLSLPENESFHFDMPSSSRPLTKPPDGNSRILNVKVMGDISKYSVLMPRIMLTQPTLVPN